MATVASIHISPTVFAVFALLLVSSFLAFGETGIYGESLDPKMLGLKQHLTHLRLYWQEVSSGANRTSIPVVQPVNGSVVSFGQINMFDIALTLGPELNSTQVGRSQGFVAQADLNQVGLLKVETFYFTAGKYSGSTIAILGRNPIAKAVREMPIVGGSGVFRFAGGYVQLRTYAFNNVTLDSTVQHDVYVLHYY